MVDIGIRVDEEIKTFLDDKKLVPRESYKSVLKRLLDIRKNTRQEAKGFIFRKKWKIRKLEKL